MNRRASRRSGVASLDYVLVLGTTLVMVAALMGIIPQIIRSVYGMVCVLISWPFI